MASSFDQLVENYIDQVKHISNINDGEFFDKCKNIILDTFTGISPEKVKGIVVGVIFNENLPKKKGPYFISTGRSKLTNSVERHKMLNELKKLHDEQKEHVIFIRFPFFACDHEEEFEELASAFEPLVVHLLKQIVHFKKRTSSGKLVSTPILTLGYRAAQSTFNCLKKTNKPLFIVLPSVHPNFMAMFEEDEARNLKCEEYLKFSEVLKKFYNFL